MAIAELDELFAQLANPEDRATLEQLLERAPAAKDRIISSEDLSRALVDNDTAAASRVEARKQAVAAAAAAQRNPPLPAAAQFDKTQFDSMVDAKVRELIPSILKGEYEKPDFNDRVTGIVKTTANGMVPDLISTTTRKADEIFTIRSANLKEFGKELDAAAFTAFVEEQAKKHNTYGTYVDAYNDFVKEQRIDKRIADGIAAGVAAHPKLQPQVPGTTLGSGSTMADAFMKSNPLNKTATERGTAINEGAQALRRMVAARAE